MVQRFFQIVTRAVAEVCVGSSLACAASPRDKTLSAERVEDTAMRVDGKAYASVTTTEGRAYPVQGAWAQVGANLMGGPGPSGEWEQTP